MSKSYVLVKGSIDYADEFYCEHFGIFTQEKWDEIVEGTKKFFEKHTRTVKKAWGNECSEHEVYFGTNEQLIFTDFDSWFSQYTVYPITEEEGKKLIALFDGDQADDVFTWGTGSNALLHFVDSDFLSEIDEEEENIDPKEDDEDEEE